MKRKIILRAYANWFGGPEVFAWAWMPSSTGGPDYFEIIHIGTRR